MVNSLPRTQNGSAPMADASVSQASPGTAGDNPFNLLDQQFEGLRPAPTPEMFQPSILPTGPGGLRLGVPKPEASPAQDFDRYNAPIDPLKGLQPLNEMLEREWPVKPPLGKGTEGPPSEAFRPSVPDPSVPPQEPEADIHIEVRPDGQQTVHDPKGLMQSGLMQFPTFGSTPAQAAPSNSSQTVDPLGPLKDLVIEPLNDLIQRASAFLPGSSKPRPEVQQLSPDEVQLPDGTVATNEGYITPGVYYSEKDVHPTSGELYGGVFGRVGTPDPKSGVVLPVLGLPAERGDFDRIEPIAPLHSRVKKGDPLYREVTDEHKKNIEEAKTAVGTAEAVLPSVLDEAKRIVVEIESIEAIIEKQNSNIAEARARVDNYNRGEELADPNNSSDTNSIIPENTFQDARTALNNAQQELERLQGRRKSLVALRATVVNLTPETTVEKVKAKDTAGMPPALVKAANDVVTAQTKLEQARKIWDAGIRTAPIDGIVVGVFPENAQPTTLDQTGELRGGDDGGLGDNPTDDLGGFAISKQQLASVQVPQFDGRMYGVAPLSESEDVAVAVSNLSGSQVENIKAGDVMYGETSSGRKFRGVVGDPSREDDVGVGIYTIGAGNRLDLHNLRYIDDNAPMTASEKGPVRVLMPGERMLTRIDYTMPIKEELGGKIHFDKSSSTRTVKFANPTAPTAIPNAAPESSQRFSATIPVAAILRDDDKPRVVANVLLTGTGVSNRQVAGLKDDNLQVSITSANGATIEGGATVEITKVETGSSIDGNSLKESGVMATVKVSIVPKNVNRSWTDAINISGKPDGVGVGWTGTSGEVALPSTQEIQFPVFVSPTGVLPDKKGGYAEVVEVITPEIVIGRAPDARKSDAGGSQLDPDEEVRVASGEAMTIPAFEPTLKWVAGDAPTDGGGEGTALTGSALSMKEAVEGIKSGELSGPNGDPSAAEAEEVGYQLYKMEALGPTNEAYKKGRFAAVPAEEREFVEAAFDAGYQRRSEDIRTTQIDGDPGARIAARRRVEGDGLEFDDRGLIVEKDGLGALDQVAALSANEALASGTIARVKEALSALPPDATPEAVAAATQEALRVSDPVVDAASGVPRSDVAMLRASAKAQVGLLSELGGNEAAVAFLRAFDLVMGAVEAAGGDFDGTALGDLLSGSAGSLGFLMEKVGAGDAGAWSALSADLGAFAKSLDDGEREAFAESAHALTVAGSTLILAGSGGTPDDALIVSGELVSIAGEGMLAAAGKAVPGFPQGVDVPPEMAVGAGFGRLLNRYADGTDTKLDDVAGILLEKGLPTWKAFDAPDVVKGGRVAVDSDLSAASSAVSLAGSVLSEVIDGRAGEIVGAVADGASTGLSLAAGSANPAQAIVGLTRSVFDVAGVEIPPEVQTGALVAMAAAQASNPVGWVALGLQLAFGLGGTKSWTEVTDVAPDIDADADFRFDDTGQISTDLHRNFWGRVKVDDGRIQYEVNGVNPELLERATFDLEARTEASLEHAEYRDWSPTLVLNGEEIAGRIETAGGDPVSFRGKVDGRRGLVERAVFVSTDDAIRLPVDVKNHGHDDDNDGYGASFSLAEGATEGLPVQHRLKVEGTYMGLNPVTGGETFSHDVTLTPEQFAAIEAELAGTEPIALEGSDPRLRGTDGDTELMRVMDAQSWTFDSERKDPNLYQYMDMNGDGALDLVRYGIKEDRDGLHSGDKRYEVTLLGPDRAELGLPTIKTDSLQRAGEIATLAPTVLAWAAARPEVGRAGHDLTSLHFAAAQAGVLDDMKELSDLNRTLGADMAAAAALLSSGDGVGDAEWDAFAASLGTDEADMAHRAELTQALGLFDAGAYGAANPDLIEALGPNPARLAAHYVAHGNREGRAIDEAGTVRPVAPPPAMPGVIHLGDTLEPGMEMRRGEMLMSGNGRFAAVFEPDGDFKVMDLQSPEGAPLWKADDDGDWIAMQTDGNLVIYEDDGRAEFATDTHGEAADRPFAATIGDDGVLRVIDAERDAVLWSSAEDRLARAAPNAAVA